MRDDLEEALRTKLVHWPTPQEYNEALQLPEQSFGDLGLRSGQPELTALGLPRPITGMFASVYRLRCTDGDWAVRCFLHNHPEHRRRYLALHECLAQLRLPFTVGFQYQEKGIQCQGAWYPILKMAWCEGETLNRWLERHLARPDCIRELAQRWKEMLRELRRHNIAHGDLQHGNVLVQNNRLKLVDYDGMYIPQLAQLSSNELGHRHYQHPERSQSDFGPWMDNFSAWIIYVSMQILALDPMLWHQLRAGDEYLLLSRSDLENATGSSVFYLLEQHHSEEVRAYSRWLRYLLSLKVNEIPDLDSPMTIERNLPPICLSEPEVLPDWVRNYDEPPDDEAVDRHAAPPADDIVIPFRRARNRKRSRTKNASRSYTLPLRASGSSKPYWANLAPQIDPADWSVEESVPPVASRSKLSSPILTCSDRSEARPFKYVLVGVMMALGACMFAFQMFLNDSQTPARPNFPKLAFEANGLANLVNTADSLYESGDPGNAQEWYSEAVVELNNVLDSKEDQFPDKMIHRNLAKAHEGLGMSYGSLDILGEAISEYEIALKEWIETTGNPQAREVAVVLTHLAMSQYAEGSVDASIGTFKKAIRIFNKYPAIQDDVRKQCMIDFADALRFKGEEAEAAKVDKYLETGTGAPYVVSERVHIIADYKVGKPVKSKEGFVR
ncbi:MAG: hypothetical protein K2W95_36165 [Candidatus Obscuribacterales bacterium]|nr:hypothetical protein [Candidatus Obscuribacterales bacterium]